MSFHFTNPTTGVLSRLEASVPHHAAYGALADLWKSYADCPLLRAAVCAMTAFNDPRVINNPENMIFRREEGGNVVAQEPFDDFKNGARCVLALSNAHSESARRRDTAYEPINELVPDRLLEEYAASGNVPPILRGAPIFPTPPRVIFELGCARKLQTFTSLPEVLEEVLSAHRDFRIEIKRIACRGASSLTREIKKKFNKKRRKMELFKKPGEDPGGAIGVLEVELRKRRLIEENLYSISSLDYETQVLAWEANKRRIMSENKIKSTKWISWKRKRELLEQFQDSHGGISLNPKIISTKHKRKKPKVEKKEFECCSERKGAATASFRALQQPQIVWLDRLIPTRKATRDDTKADVLVITAHALNELPASTALNLFCAMIVLNPGKTKLRSDLAELDPPKTFVLSKECEMKRIALLVQWLPLVPSDPWASESRKLPYLKTWCTTRAQLLNKHLQENRAYMDEDEFKAVEALLRQTRCLHAFAAACGMKDLPTVPVLEKLVSNTEAKEFWDAEQARKLFDTHDKVAWMVAEHMKR